MVSFEYKIKDAVGIHARPAGLIVKEAMKYNAVITMKAPKKEVDLKKILAVMSAGVKCGDTVVVRCDGVEEEAAKQALEVFFKSNL